MEIKRRLATVLTYAENNPVVAGVVVLCLVLIIVGIAL